MAFPYKDLKALLQKPWLPYVAPFVIFLLLTGPVNFFPTLSPYFYIAKTIIVGSLLWHWREHYSADFRDSLTLKQLATAVICGLVVLVIWILPEGFLYQLDKTSQFDPLALGESQTAIAGLIILRLMGSSLVVPFMEELFWRSFLMRYLINPDFRSIPIGAFSWFSYTGVAIMFGLEHHRVIAGVIAGLLYGFLLIYQANLKGVVVAHGITNFGLGMYIIATGKWMFW